LLTRGEAHKGWVNTQAILRRRHQDGNEVEENSEGLLSMF
jgi:hypothetical protein